MAEEGLDSDEEREIERQEQEEDEAAYEPEYGAQDEGEVFIPSVAERCADPRQRRNQKYQ
jgi:hypothetical protein